MIMSRRKLKIGDDVDITAGDESGGWGRVQLVYPDEIHVALYGDRDDSRVFQRRELKLRQSEGN
jgi:ribosomal protein L24